MQRNLLSMQRTSHDNAQNLQYQCSEPPLSMHSTPLVKAQKVLFNQCTDTPLIQAQNPPVHHKGPPPYQCPMLDSNLPFRCTGTDSFLPVHSWKAEWANSSSMAGLYGLCLILLITKTHNQYGSSAFCHLKCCQHQQSCGLAGGDTFLQICLWEAGHAVTSPGAGFYDWQMRSFDAGSEDRMGLVDYIMRAIEGTCHDRGLCNVRTHLTIKRVAENLNISKKMCNKSLPCLSCT